MTASSFRCLLIILLAITGLLQACQQGNEKDPSALEPLNNQLPGVWEQISLSISMPSFENTDALKVQQVNENQWREGLGIQPIRTYFIENGTYYTEYRDLEDSIIHIPAGSWHVQGDSLYMEETGQETLTYHINLKGDTLELSSVLDWDEDGAADDHYSSILVRRDENTNSERTP